MPAKGPSHAKERGVDGAEPFPSFPGPSPPNSSGISGTTQPPVSLSFKEAEALETETKLFEDLEFQQLEQQSRVEEERELAGQGLLRSQAELLRSVARRKVGRPPAAPSCRGWCTALGGARPVTWV